MSSRKRSRAEFYSKTAPKGVVAMYRAPLRPAKRRKALFVPGVDRTGGFYGRYSGRNAELKFHDVDLNDAVVSNTAAVTPTINIIAQGVTESQRIGRKCTIKSINWRYYITLPLQDAVALPVTGDTLRMILYLDKQANGATATSAGILESDDWQSFRNLANSGRFQVLLDKDHTINYRCMNSDGAGLTSQSQVVTLGSFYKKCNIPVEFDSTTGAITEIRSNNIGLLLISSQGICGFESKFRLRFSDGS